MRRRRRAYSALFAFTLTAFVSSTAICADFFGGQPVAPAGVGFGALVTSIALDSTDAPCIAYYDGGGGDLYFAQLVGQTWSISVVDTTGDTGQYCSLAIDANGDPHIAYYYAITPSQASADQLMYATRSGGSWTTEVVDGTDVSGFCDLVLDSSGTPHIVYFNGNSLDLKYAVKNGGSWTLDTVDSGGFVGEHAELIIDASDNLHVAYRDADNNGLKYGIKTGGSWTLEAVAGINVFPPMSITPIHIGMALDSSGDVHIVFRDDSNAKSMYAHNTSGSWSTDIARALGQDLRGSFHSLQIDTNDVPVMTYFDDFWSNSRLARFNGTWWVPVSIEAAGWGLSLTLDSNDLARVSYHETIEAEIQYLFESDIVSDATPGAGETRLYMAVSPNPMFNSTTLFMRTSVSMTLGLEILDARGRLVRRLPPRQHQPGLVSMTWDGRDNAGRAVGAGVYFAVSRPAHLFAPGKIVVVR